MPSGIHKRAITARLYYCTTGACGHLGTMFYSTIGLVAQVGYLVTMYYSTIAGWAPRRRFENSYLADTSIPPCFNQLEWDPSMLRMLNNTCHMCDKLILFALCSLLLCPSYSKLAWNHPFGEELHAGRDFLRRKGVWDGLWVCFL